MHFSRWNNFRTKWFNVARPWVSSVIEMTQLCTSHLRREEKGVLRTVMNEKERVELEPSFMS